MVQVNPGGMEGLVEDSQNQREKKCSPGIRQENVDSGAFDCFFQSIRADQLYFEILADADHCHHRQTKNNRFQYSILISRFTKSGG